MILMSKPLSVSVCKVCRLGALKGGHMGASQARAERILLALKYTQLN